MNLLPRAVPEAVGVSPVTIANFFKELSATGQEIHSVMIVKKGSVIAEAWWEPYRADLPHLLYSLSKSFASTAVGFAVDEGLITLDDCVIDHFPDDLPDEISANLREMRIRHLLSMSCGHDTEPQVWGAESWAKAFLAHPVPHVPDTHFVYNSISTYMAGAIVQKITGRSLLEYLRPRLLDPLEVEFATWQQNSEGFDVGGWGMSITTETIAKFGLLYLQQGDWEDEQVLPVGWAQTATKKHVDNGFDPNNDWNQGYGFQFWRCCHNAYRGDGAFGQLCIVMPDQETVVAATASVTDIQAVLSVIWNNLLQDSPHSDHEVGRSPAFSLPVVPNKVTKPVEGTFSTVDGVEIEIYFDGEAGTAQFNGSEWKLSTGEWPIGTIDEPFVATAGWVSESYFVIEGRDATTPFRFRAEVWPDVNEPKLTINTHGRLF